MDKQIMNPFWCKFEIHSDTLSFFEYKGPWWIDGYGHNFTDGYGFIIIVAAIRAKSSNHAKEIIISYFGNHQAGVTHWDRFRKLNPDWQPSTSKYARFKKSEHMQW